MKKALLATLAAFVITGCPKDAPPPDAHKGETVAAAGSGTLDLLVHDENGRPIEGAVAWAPGLQDGSPLPAEPAVLSQEGLEFRPRFLVARRGQTLEVRNSDAEVHNVHAACDCYPWNDMIKTGDVFKHELKEAGEATVTCNIHGHMRCTLLVLDAPHAVSDVEGHTRLALPLGPRKLRIAALDRDRKDLDLTVAAVTTAEVVLPLSPQIKQVRAPEKLPWPTVAVNLGDALDEAVRRARRHDADGAKAAVLDALEEWYTGSGFFGAIKQASAHPELAEGEKSELRKLASRAENAANGGDPDKLAQQVEKIKNTLLDIARGLPKR